MDNYIKKYIKEFKLLLGGCIIAIFMGFLNVFILDIKYKDLELDYKALVKDKEDIKSRAEYYSNKECITPRELEYILYNKH